MLHQYGLVVPSRRWYVTGTDPAIGEDRTFRLDHFTYARLLPGSLGPPADLDPSRRVLSGLATAPYSHEVALRVQGTPEHIRSRLPADVATVAELPSSHGVEGDQGPRPGSALELQVERFDRLPAVLAPLDGLFVIERPEEQRGLAEALAARLAPSARRRPPRV